MRRESGQRKSPEQQLMLLQEAGRISGKIRFPMYLSDELDRTDISELEMSVRAVNCLRRAGFQTVGQLVRGITRSDDLRRIRNCGQTSIKEIMNTLLMYQFSQLPPDRQESYLRRIVYLSSLSETEAAPFLDDASSEERGK